MAREVSQKQRFRELLVHKFAKACEFDRDLTEEFDEILCNALELDAKNIPSDFLDEIFAFGR